jgi:hypothetical protein
VPTFGSVESIRGYYHVLGQAAPLPSEFMQPSAPGSDAKRPAKELRPSLRATVVDPRVVNSLTATLFAFIAVMSALTLGRSVAATGWGHWFHEQWPLITSPVASTILNIKMLWKYWLRGPGC